MRKLAILITLLVSIISITSAFAQDTSNLDKAVKELAQTLAFGGEGMVIDVAGNDITIDLGREHGILEGAEFEVVRLGDAIVIEGKIKGYREKKIGSIRVERARDTYSVASRIHSMVVKLKPQDTDKIRIIVDMVEKYVDIDDVISSLR